VLPLSQRLEAIVQLLRPCALLADVGTDHGYVPIAAVQRRVAVAAIASDLRAAPLLAAAENVRRAGVGAQVSLMRGDGLLPLVGLPVDALVLAGMGGHLMLQLFAAAPPAFRAQLCQFVVQPNEDVHLIRAWASGAGFHLCDERMIAERGKFFTVCAFHRAPGADPVYARSGWSLEDLCRVGPWFLARKDVTALRAYEQQHTRYQGLVDQGVQARAADAEFWRATCAALR
jgi:tRNA (adenine22-N1)-methyltransferase